MTPLPRNPVPDVPLSLFQPKREKGTRGQKGRSLMDPGHPLAPDTRPLRDKGLVASKNDWAERFV